MSVIFFFGMTGFVVLVSSIYVGVSIRHLWQNRKIEKAKGLKS